MSSSVGSTSETVCAGAQTPSTCVRGKLTYVFNYANDRHVIEGVDAQRFVIGTHEVEPQGVSAYRTE